MNKKKINIKNEETELQEVCFIVTKKESASACTIMVDGDVVKLSHGQGSIKLKRGGHNLEWNFSGQRGGYLEITCTIGTWEVFGIKTGAIFNGRHIENGHMEFEI